VPIARPVGYRIVESDEEDSDEGGVRATTSDASDSHSDSDSDRGRSCRCLYFVDALTFACV